MYCNAGKHVGSSGEVPDCFMIPHGFENFYSHGTRVETDESGKVLYVFHGDLETGTYYCPRCQEKMHINNTFSTTLRHLPFGSGLSFVRFTRHQYLCPVCHQTCMERVGFRAKHHMITTALEQYAEDLLAYGFTNKEVAEQTGLNKNTVKAIDLDRLRRKYTTISNEGEEAHRVLKKPEKTARFLAIDEFKLHNGYRYATHIIDIASGHILWIAHGKSKQVVFDFIAHVGEEWMSHVEAVACDMNSDFQEAFEERCEWIQPVFDRFHVIKNFNDKVISAVRKDEQRRLEAAGDKKGAATLKHTKYIAVSNRTTLAQKDAEAEQGKILSHGSKLFKLPEVKRHGGYMERYQTLLNENKLLFTADLVKNQLRAAYEQTSETAMADILDNIIDTCTATGNRHFLWFASLVEKHFEGITAFAAFHITSGKIEGINNRIKTIRRQSYGIPDDEYFFLKLFDASRKPYVNNPKSHMIWD